MSPRITRSKIKKISLITIITVICVSLVLGLSLGLTLKKLKTPEVKIINYSGEPNYLINIEWNSIFRAERYLVEYKYTDLYSTRIYSEYVKDNKISVSRKRGLFEVRVKALASKHKFSGLYSDWVQLEIPAFKISDFGQFNLVKTARGLQVDSSFRPATYTFRGVKKDVEFYQVEDNFSPEPIILTLGELKEYVFGPTTSGSIEYKFTPINYSYLKEPQNQILYEPVELYEMFGVGNTVTVIVENPDD